MLADYTDSQLAQAVLTNLGWTVNVVQEPVPVHSEYLEEEVEDQYDVVDLVGLYDPSGELRAGYTITEQDLWEMVGLYGFVHQAIVKDIADGGQLVVIYDEEGVKVVIDVYVQSEENDDDHVLVQVEKTNPDPSRGARAMAEAWCDIAGISD